MHNPIINGHYLCPFYLQCPNELRRDKEAVSRLFADKGLKLHVLVAEWTCGTSALVETSDGQLLTYYHDTSHGGGGMFVLDR